MDGIFHICPNRSYALLDKQSLEEPGAHFNPSVDK